MRRTQVPCGLMRRFAVILYDTLLLLAVLFIATFALLPLTGGEAIAAANPFYGAYLVLLSLLFFGWFWTHGGQTLGMRAWRVKIQRCDGSPVDWWHAVLRFLSAVLSWAAFGAGFAWSLYDRDRRTWHDRLSDTMLTVLPKR